MRTFIALTALCSLLSLPGVFGRPITEGTISSYYPRAPDSTDQIMARQIADSHAAVALLERSSDSDVSRRPNGQHIPETDEGKIHRLENELKQLQEVTPPNTEEITRIELLLRRLKRQRRVRRQV
jgi:hypothetical protein